MLVAKRKVDVTWRDAVARRAAERGDPAPCLASFDRLVRSGCTDAEAAHGALAQASLLWPVIEPGGARDEERSTALSDPDAPPLV